MRRGCTQKRSLEVVVAPRNPAAAQDWLILSWNSCENYFEVNLYGVLYHVVFYLLHEMLPSIKLKRFSIAKTWKQSKCPICVFHTQWNITQP